MREYFKSLPCTDFCDYLGAELDPEQWCFVDMSEQYQCSCVNYSCVDSDAVQNQCDFGVYSECTCAAADPCGWANDQYCDTPTCQYLYPELSVFDDTGSAACGT